MEGQEGDILRTGKVDGLRGLVDRLLGWVENWRADMRLFERRGELLRHWRTGMRNSAAKRADGRSERVVWRAGRLDGELRRQVG